MYCCYYVTFDGLSSLKSFALFIGKETYPSLSSKYRIIGLSKELTNLCRSSSKSNTLRIHKT